MIRSTRLGVHPAITRRPSLLILGSVATLLAACGGGGEDADPRRSIAAAPPADVRSIELGGSPRAVAVGAGATWVADPVRGRVVAVDPRRLERLGRPVEVAAPLALAADADAAWIASGTGAVHRIDARTREAREVARVADPGGIAAGAGAAWVTSRADGTVVPLDPRTGAAGRPIRVGRAPADVAVGFGSVWVANGADGSVTRIDPATRRVVGEPIVIADAQVLALAAGEDGVWVAGSDSAQNAAVVLRRIDPAEAKLADDGPLALPPGVPIDIAAGLDSVWATDGGNFIPGTPRRPPALVRVGAEAGALAGAPLEVPAQPGGVAVGADAVWVTSSATGVLQRITPGALRPR